MYSFRQPYKNTELVDLGVKYDKYSGTVGTLRKYLTSEGRDYARKRAEYKRKQYFEFPMARDRRDSPAPRLIADAPTYLIEDGRPVKDMADDETHNFMKDLMEKYYGQPYIKHSRIGGTHYVYQSYDKGVMRIVHSTPEDGYHVVTRTGNGARLYDPSGDNPYFPKYAGTNERIQSHGTCAYFSLLAAFYPHTSNEELNDAIDRACQRTGLTPDEVVVDIVHQLKGVSGIRKTDDPVPQFKKGGIIVAKKK